MSRWFRLHDEVLDDPKVQRLPAEDFRGWINLLCLASRHDGRIPAVEDVSFALRVTPDGAKTLLERLRSAGLIVRKSGGPNGAFDAPYNWDKRQYKSDTSTERVKRFRQRSQSAPETAPETETETETETEDGSNEPSPRCWVRPDYVEPQVWRDLLANRKRKRLTNSPTSWKLFQGDLTRVSAETGRDPLELIEYAAGKGWGSINAPDNRSNGNGTGQSSGRSRTTEAAEAAFGPIDTWTDDRPF